MDPVELKSIPLFARLGDADRARLALYLDELEVPKGKRLTREGELAYEFFVILDGHAEVLKDGERVADLGPDDFFGEIGLLESERRTATVVAGSPMRILIMFGPDFRRFERELPEVAEKVRGAIRERIAADPEARPA